MMKIRKAVIPAAGRGTRFLPATKAQPKEMLPIVDKPVIQYLVEEAAASGIEQVIIITGQSKRAIEDHFDRTFELEYSLAELANSINWRRSSISPNWSSSSMCGSRCPLAMATPCSWQKMW